MRRTINIYPRQRLRVIVRQLRNRANELGRRDVGIPKEVPAAAKVLLARLLVQLDGIIPSIHAIPLHRHAV